MADAFSLPGPYQQQQNEIARRQKMAEMLQAQAFAPDTAAPSYNGIPVPVSAFSGLSKALAGIGGGYLQNKAIEEQKALGEKAQTETKEFLTGLQGTPRAAKAGTPEYSPEMAYQDFANWEADPANVGQPYTAKAIQPAIPETPAGVTPLTPAQRTAMLLGGMTSGNPYIQNIAGPLYAQSIKETKLAPGEAVFDSAGKRLYGVAPKGDFSKNLQNITRSPLSSTGWVATVVDGATGDLKIVETPAPTNQYTAPTKEGEFNRAQTRAISDRAFYNLSADQQAQIEQRAKQLGISGAELYFNTGIQAPGVPAIGGAAGAPTGAPPQAAPVAAPTGQPASAPPVAAPGGVPAVPAMTPKQLTGVNTEIAKNNAMQVLKMGGLPEASASARAILTGTKIDPNGKLLNGEPLPTHSGFGAFLDYVNGMAFGGSTTAADKAAALKAISANLVMKMPRFEGPQSDKDTAQYREAAGNVGDASLPLSQRLAALDQVDALYKRYTDQMPSQANKVLRYNPKTGKIE